MCVSKRVLSGLRSLSLAFLCGIHSACRVLRGLSSCCWCVIGLMGFCKGLYVFAGS